MAAESVAGSAETEQQTWLEERLQRLACLAAIGHSDVAQLKSLADDLLGASFYSDEILDIWDCDSPYWSDYAAPFSGLCRRANLIADPDQAFLWLVSRMAERAQEAQADRELVRFYEIFAYCEVIDRSGNGFWDLWRDYCEMNEPPFIRVPPERRDGFARASFERWSRTYHEEVERLPRATLTEMKVD